MELGGVKSFAVTVAPEVLADLRERLSRTRLADGFPAGDWDYGTDAGYLRELLDYWSSEFDWAAQEQRLQAVRHYRYEIDGVPIHFVAEPGVGPAPMPLVLTHGWPWTFWDYRKVIGPLADPAAHGGDPADAFDVVVPSLPGFGFSTPLRVAGVNFWVTADLWHRLLTEVLRVARFGVHGGDWGAFVSAQLGHKYEADVIGVHMHLLPWLEPCPMPTEGYAPDEQRWVEKAARHRAMGSGYSAVQFSKPLTIGHALTDSPAALASWLVEKRRDWTEGELESVFTKDDLCTMLTIYWATASGASAARFYGEYMRNPWQPSHERMPRVGAPTGVAVFPGELFKPPRAWAEQYYNLQRYTELPRGGHFAPMEQPDALVADIREFFRPLRANATA